MQMMQRVNAVIPDLGTKTVEFYQRRISRFTRYEQVLAALIMLIPWLLLWAGDSTPLTEPCPDFIQTVPDNDVCRDSISAFHDLAFAPVFYMPLTVAAFMFISNAALRTEHWWNAFAGIALAALTFFDHDDYSTLHTAAAAAFFAITMLVVAWYLPKDLAGSTGIQVPVTAMRAAITIGIFVAQVGLFALLYVATNLFVAEAVAMWIVAGHYIFHSIKHAEHDEADSA